MREGSLTHGFEGVKKSQTGANCFTQRRKVRKGRKAKKGLRPCVSSRLCDFARAALIFSHLLTPWATFFRPLSGLTYSGRLLVVCFAARGESVRMLSARTATRRERKDYEENVEW